MRFEFSAGGIVVKKEGEQTYVLLAQHAGHHGWVFPKGLIGDASAQLSTGKTHETKEEASVREVAEETGVLTRLGRPLKPVTYWYQMQGEKRKKTVYYFLMEYISEDPLQKDDEMERVEWLPIADVEKRLTYPSDKKVWQEAQKYIK